MYLISYKVMIITRTPIEIWYQIIREATWIPSWVLNGALYDPMHKPRQSTLNHPQEIYPFLRRFFQMKLSIALVCKSWSHICSEFLHEFLLIRDEETIARLVNKFKTINMHAHKVLRIDFSPSNLSSCFNSSAPALISACPSLLTVAFHYHTYHIEDRVYEVLAESRSLRCLEWYIPCQLPKAFSSSLKAQDWSLYVGIRYHNRGLEGNVEPNWSDMLKTTCDTTERASDENLVPIRHMVLGDWVNWGSFLDTRHVIHTMNILTLCGFILRYQTDFVSNLSPSVHSLLIYVRDIPFTGVSFVAQHVKHIGLRVRGNSMPSPAEFDHYLSLFVGNSTSQLYLPSLRLLQLVDAPLANGLRSRPYQLRLWTRRCASWGISLCDEYGNQFRS